MARSVSIVSGGFLSGHPLLLGRHSQGGQLVEVSLIGGLTVKRSVRAPAVEEQYIAANRGPGFAYVGVGVDVDLLVFNRPPEPFYHDFVPPSALAVHADLHMRHLHSEGTRGVARLTLSRASSVAR